LSSKVSPAISNIKIYLAPKLLEPPSIHRDKGGMVTIESFDTGLSIRYSEDDSAPSKTYQEPFLFDRKGQIKAVAIDTVSGKTSEMSLRNFDIVTVNWSVAGNEENNALNWIIDSNEQTFWRNTEYPKDKSISEITIDLGSSQLLAGFTYLPPQSSNMDGTVASYRLEVSENGKDWVEAATGEFSNIRNSPILQIVSFKKVNARYIRFSSLREINDKPIFAIAELGVITN
jgi:alpha-L-fucosidase